MALLLVIAVSLGIVARGLLDSDITHIMVGLVLIVLALHRND